MEKEIKNQKNQRHRCIKCQSTFCYLRVKTGEWVCRSCGNVEEKKGESS